MLIQKATETYCFVTLSSRLSNVKTNFFVPVYEVPEKLSERYFSASHPFLYFVIDKESKVSLVAGIMADPSKQHIHLL